MGVGTIVHHIGTLLLFVSTALLIAVSVTAPAVHNFSILRIDVGQPANPYGGGFGGGGFGGGFGSPFGGGGFGNPFGSQYGAVGAYGSGLQRPEVTFGSFGYCLRGFYRVDQCTNSQLGYNPAEVMALIDGTIISRPAETTAKGLTRAMILHPIAVVLCFIAFLLCLGAGIVGSLMASVFAFLAFLITLIAMICDFVAFGIIRHDVNQWNRSSAHWGPGIWCVMVAAIFTLFASLLVLVTCCAGRAKEGREDQNKDNYNGGVTEAKKGPFWKRG